MWSRNGRPTHRSPSSTSTSATCAGITASPSTSATRMGCETDTGKLHDVLETYGVANTFEIYKGTHTSAVAVRFQNYVMPFFSTHLCFEARCK